MNRFGDRVRELRKTKGYSLRKLGPLVGVGFTYLSKVESGKLDFGDSPSSALIARLATALDADADELLLLAVASRIPLPTVSANSLKSFECLQGVMRRS